MLQNCTAANTKSAKMRELVQFMGRRNQLDVLEAKLRDWTFDKVNQSQLQLSADQNVTK
jgi:hypothetical protein